MILNVISAMQNVVNVKKLPGTKSSLKAQLLQFLTFPVKKRSQRRFHLSGKSDTNSEAVN